MNQLDEITLAHGWLQQLRPLPRDVVEELRHRYEVALTHHSTAIEGNTLTQSETQIVIEKGITIGGKSVAEHLEVIGHKEALDFVVELATESSPIGEWEIRQIHSLVMKGQGDADIGRYRTLDVKAAGMGFVYPSHLRLYELMSEFVSWLAKPPIEHPVLFASEAHRRFVTIHPFRDGNGRVGRLLMNLLLIRNGYPIAVLPVGRRLEYINALEAAQSGHGRSSLDSLVIQATAASLRDTLTTALSSSEIALAPAVREDIRAWLAVA